jgi:hypothetical protein
MAALRNAVPRGATAAPGRSELGGYGGPCRGPPRPGRHRGPSGEFGNPDFVALARAFGCDGIRIGAAKELRPALGTALDARVPVLIDCPVDYRENDRLAEI